MEPNNDLKEPETIIEVVDADTTASVDDFIKELEAKEKDLHSGADYEIEIEDSDLSDPAVPDFVQQDLPQPAVTQTPVAPAPANGQPAGMKTRVYELEKEVEKLEARVRDLRAERNEVQEKSDRRLKDFENYKYRMDRERRGAFIDQISNLAKQMLPVLDNLDRAMGSLDKGTVAKSPEFQQFYDGIALVHNQVNEI